MEEKIRVLTLDGGGVRGYLSAKILFNLETLLNNENNENINIGQRFDLIVGTSTGGIIACALSIGKSAKEIFELYEILIPKVFTPISKGYFKNKYSSKALRKELDNILGDKELKDVITGLCITSVDVENSSPRFHKSNYFERNAPRQDEKLLDLALATSAAPTYFSLVDSKHSTNLTDGGVVANNPSLVGLIDAMQLTSNNIEQISLVSIGTGDQCHMPYNVEKLKNSGKLKWIYQSNSSPILELLMESQSKLAHFQTGFLLGDRYIRLNPKLSVTIELDSVDKIDSLKNLADISKKDLDMVQKLLF
ncbi:MAG: patatin-like phospholipase family protein [Methylococcales symbiont of Iophon sp. n. MRB-2018]|nr:MAG: patatin-like phospholipase family protein [Methylococcales symbiont of Iophon sp. n. MRB-2018]